MDRIDLRYVRHEVRHRWMRGKPGDVNHAVITTGQLITGDWYAARFEAGATLAWLTANGQHAVDVVDGWIRRQGGPDMWREVRQ